MPDRKAQETHLMRLDEEEINLVRLFRYCNPQYRYLICQFISVSVARSRRKLPPNVFYLAGKHKR